MSFEYLNDTLEIVAFHFYPASSRLITVALRLLIKVRQEVKIFRKTKGDGKNNKKTILTEVED